MHQFNASRLQRKDFVGPGAFLVSAALPDYDGTTRRDWKALAE